MIDGEIFIPVKGYEGLYEISDHGRLKSLNYNHTGLPRIMKPSVGARGYYQTVLFKNGSKEYFCIYQIVAISFLNHDLSKLDHIHHINLDKTDDRLINLEIVSCRENILQCKYDSISAGVSKHKNKYRARISYYGYNIHIGLFKSISEANDAYMMFFEYINELRKLKIID